LIDLLI